MAYKMKGSPLRQGLMGNIFAANQQPTNTNSIMGGIFGANQQPANVTSTIGNLANSALSSQWASQNLTPTTPTNKPTPTSGYYNNTTKPFDAIGFSHLSGNTQQPNAIKDSSVGVKNATANINTPKTNEIKPVRQRAINPSMMNETPINPKAIGNPNTITKVSGRANAGTFTRTVPGNEAPTMQLANPNVLEDGPELPPQGVQTSVTPTLGFENS